MISLLAIYEIKKAISDYICGLKINLSHHLIPDYEKICLCNNCFFPAFVFAI